MAHNNFMGLITLGNEVLNLRFDIENLKNRILISDFYNNTSKDIQESIEKALSETKQYDIDDVISTSQMPISANEYDIFAEYNSDIDESTIKQRTLIEQVMETNFNKSNSLFTDDFLNEVSKCHEVFKDAIYDISSNRLFKKKEDGYKLITSNVSKSSAHNLRQLLHYIVNPQAGWAAADKLTKAAQCDSISDVVKNIINTVYDYKDDFEQCNIAKEMIEKAAELWDGKDYISGAASYHFSTKNTTYNNRLMFAYLCQSLYNMLSNNATHKDYLFILECAQGVGKSFLSRKLSENVLKDVFDSAFTANEISLASKGMFETYINGFGLSSVIENKLYTLISDPAYLDEGTFITFADHITKPTLLCNDKNEKPRNIASYASKVLSWNVKLPIKLKDPNSRRLRFFRGINVDENSLEIEKFRDSVKATFNDRTNFKAYYQLFYQCCKYVLTHDYAEFYNIIKRNDVDAKMQELYAGAVQNEVNGDFFQAAGTALMGANEVSCKKLKEIYDNLGETDYSLRSIQSSADFKRIFKAVRKHEGRAYEVNQAALTEVINKYVAIANGSLSVAEADYNTLDQWKKDVIAYQDKIMNGPTYTDPTPRFVYDNGLIEETNVEIHSENVAVANSNSSEEDIDALDLIETVEYEEEVDLYDEAWNLIDYEEEEIIDENGIELPDDFEDIQTPFLSSRVDAKTLTKTRLVNLYDIDKQMYYDLDFEGNQTYHEQPVDVGNIYKISK